MSKVLKGRFINKTDSKQNWEKNNPILLQGELGFEEDNNLFKVGDGIHHWKDLQYSNAGASAVASTADYAKNSGALQGSSLKNINDKFNNYVLVNRIESSMSTSSAIDKIPTSQAVIKWVLDQDFVGSGDVTIWEDF